MHARDRYDSLIVFYAEQYGLPWVRVKRQIGAESGFHADAVSPAGAQGLAQFMPEVWSKWGEGDVFNPEASIHACCRYMAYLYSRFGEIPSEAERYRFALAAYNTGRGNINRCLAVARKAGGHPAEYSDWVAAGRPSGPWQTWDFASRYLDRVTGPHARETLTYVDRVLWAGEKVPAWAQVK